MAKTMKKRHWAMIVYPEGNPPAPDNWREILRDTGLKIAISPIHDRDIEVDEDTGEVSGKPHWHVIMCWDGPTTYNVAKELSDKLNATNPQPLESVRGYYRYLTHIDHPNKYQYDAKDIETIGGFDIRDYVEITRKEVDDISRQLVQMVRDRDISEYSRLIEILLDENLSDAYNVARTSTVFLSKYIDSRRYRQEKGEEVKRGGGS